MSIRAAGWRRQPAEYGTSSAVRGDLHRFRAFVEMQQDAAGAAGHRSTSRTRASSNGPLAGRVAESPGRKVMTLVHGMVAGADSIDAMDALRTGSTGLVLGYRVMAPSTLGTLLRAFSSGMSASSPGCWTSRSLAWDAGVGPGDGPLVMDSDSSVCEVHGYEEQGAGYGRRLRVHPCRAARIRHGRYRRPAPANPGSTKQRQKTNSHHAHAAVLGMRRRFTKRRRLRAGHLHR